MPVGRPSFSRHSVSLCMIACAVFLLPAANNRLCAQSLPENHAPAAVDSGAAVKMDAMRGLFPSQSHAMMDVSYHFTNLWFAGQHANWSLAQFYLNETRNHIKWAIRLVPVRRTGAGPLRLEDIFSNFDAAKLGAIQGEIAAQDRNKFNAAYRDAITGCNDCHEKAEKPYLRVIVPRQPDAHGIDFEPPAAKK